MKYSIFILITLAFTLMVGAQDSVDSDTNHVTGRPNESDILLNEGGDVAVAENAGNVDNLPGVGAGDFVRMLLVLGFIIALIYGFFWLLKRFSGIKAEGEDAISLISTRPLKGDAALHLVETGNRLFLIGSSSNNINLLAEIDDKETIDKIRLSASQTRKNLGKFAGLLRSRMSPSSGQVEETISTDYMQDQKDRLRNL